PVGGLAELRPDRLDVLRIADDQPVAQAAIDDDLGGDRGVVAAGECRAPANGAMGRRGANQGDVTRLAVVVGLGIAERKRLDAGDLLLAHGAVSIVPTRAVRPSRAARYMASTNSTVSTPSEAGDPFW